jgi:uncharacterized membrane protein
VECNWHRTYPRGSEEFIRVLALTDGVVAIAITLRRE